jgi:hypothetical protein
MKVNHSMPMTSINTLGITYCCPTVNGENLFTVKSDVSAADALEHASILQDCVNQLMAGVALGTPSPHAALAAMYLGQMAKALLDDVAYAIATPR